MTVMDVERATSLTPPQENAAPRGTLATLRLMFGALPDSLFAYRRYEYLRTKGTPHRAAITRALGATSSREG
jgi:hypothetical protein